MLKQLKQKSSSFCCSKFLKSLLWVTVTKWKAGKEYGLMLSEPIHMYIPLHFIIVKTPHRTSLPE